MTALRERTFVMVKPDGVQRGFVGEIIKRFEKKGFKLVALKFLKPPEDLIREHYRDLASRRFFPDLVKYISSGPVVPMVWEAPSAVSLGRQMVGAKNFADSQLGNIRGDFCVSPCHDSCNVIHGSDSVDAAEKEIGLWFTEKEIVDWRPAVENWVLPIL